MQGLGLEINSANRFELAGIATGEVADVGEWQGGEAACGFNLLRHEHPALAAETSIQVPQMFAHAFGACYSTREPSTGTDYVLDDK